MHFESIPGSTPSLLTELHEQLRALVPGAFPDGVLDPQALLASLGVGVSEPRGFVFSWPGIEAARAEARAPTSATLVPDKAGSRAWDRARDVLIEGDNLQVLKILKRGYAGKAKLIYIDPPYNTGETFTYNDDYSMSEAQYLNLSGQIDAQGGATTSRLEAGGKKHAPWLTMMLPRLILARHLLKRDGTILVSIDDNEFHHLRLLLDATFGAANFIGTFVWQGGRKNDARRISVGHDYIVAYARDLSYLKDKDVRWRERKSGLEPVYAKVAELRMAHGKDFTAIRSDLMKWYRGLADDNPSKAHDHFNYVDERGIYFPDNLRSPNPRENLVYDYKGYKPHANGWAVAYERMVKLDEENRIHYPEHQDQRLKLKSYLEEHEEWAPGSVFYKDRRAASKALDSLFGACVFDYPKDVDVLARLFHAMTSDDDLVIDFFSGSGSTGHAIWQQNQADKASRRWVMVQAPEKVEITEESGKTALEQGYKTIFEISRARTEKVANQLASTSDEFGFRVFRAHPSHLKISPPLTATAGLTGDQYVQLSLAHMNDPPVQPGADPLAVAWEVVLKATDLTLDAAVITHEVEGVQVFEFTRPGDEEQARLFITLDSFTLAVADRLGLREGDTLIVRSDKTDDSTTLTLAPRLQSKLLLIERVPREISL